MSAIDESPLDGGLSEMQPFATLSTAGGWKLRLRSLAGAGITRTFFLSIAALLVLNLAIAAPSFAALKRGGQGADSLAGTPRADTILGAAGNDTVFGKAGPDKLVGGPGEDRLKGDGGQDKILGGDGNDLLLAKDAAVDRVDCGAGSEDIAAVDAVDMVSNCEQIVGQVDEESAGPILGPPAPSASSGPPSQSLPKITPPEVTPEEEEPQGGFEEQPLAMFPDEHGWTGNGVGSFGDVGPPLVVNNERSFRITTDGSGDESIATSPPLKPIDLTGFHVTVQGQVGSSSRLDAVKLRLASGNIGTDYAEATVWESDFDPIILRSSFEFQSLPVGGFHVVGSVDWSKITRAQLIVTDNGTGPVNFYAAGIYAVPTVNRATVSFSFDDGYGSVFTRGLKKLSAYRYPASAYVIANVVGEPGQLSLEQLYTLRDLDHWEIGGHALTLASHNLANGLDGLEPEALKTEMDGLRDWLDERGFSRASFAYPKGAAGPEVRRYAKRDYCAARSTAKGPETIPARDNYTLRGWSINGLTTGVAQIDEAIDRAVAEGTWLILTFHNLVGGAPSQTTEFNDDDFAEVVDHVRGLQEKGKLKVRTIGGVVGSAC
jgi:peptidoglycan/xylan/chitin deacetylase (PgdA/CDA1 family)